MAETITPTQFCTSLAASFSDPEQAERVQAVCEVKFNDLRHGREVELAAMVLPSGRRPRFVPELEAYIGFRVV